MDAADLNAEKLNTFLRITTTPYPVAQTPKELIWRLNKAKLYRYVPLVPPEQRHPVPLLLVFALINRPYILDLRPGNSFVEYMLEQGYDVYLLDWGAPGPEDKDLKLDDYALDYLPRAIRKVKSISGSGELSMLGWCIGAILALMYAARHPDQGLRNLVMLTAPLDFSNKEAGGFASWIAERNFDVDLLLHTFGNMPGELIGYAARALRPVESYYSQYVKLWESLDDPRAVESWHALSTWIRDEIPVSGAAFRQIIVDLYRENRLMNGTLPARGAPLDLGCVRANLLNIIAEADHITPPCQSETVIDRVGSRDKRNLRIAGGHISMMAGGGAIKRTWPQIDAWLAQRSGSSGQWRFGQETKLTTEARRHGERNES